MSEAERLRGAKRLRVEIARTDAERRRGLAGRPTLAPDAGMLFVFHHDVQPSFTNAGTLVPLSLAFLAQDLRVLELADLPSIHETLRPVTATPRQAVRHVLEAPRGWFDRAGVRVGDQLRLRLQPDGRSGIMTLMNGAVSSDRTPVSPGYEPSRVRDDSPPFGVPGSGGPVWNLEQPSGYTPPAPASAEIKIGENGYIHGVDGMLDQIAAALSRHAGPMLVRDVLPVVRADHELQARVGSVVGDRIAQELKPYLLVGAGALVVLATLAFMRARSSAQSQSAVRTRPPASRRVRGVQRKS